MSFASPILLLSLLVVPALLGLSALAARRRRRFAVRHPAVDALVAAAGPRRPWRRRVPMALALAGIAALALSLARPERTVAVPVEQASIMLVTDTSRSMLADDVSPSRLAAAQQAARDFLGQVPASVRVGITSYSDSPAVSQTPTEDRAPVRATIDGLLANGGTATGDALRAALNALRPDGVNGIQTPAAIVLLSDGATTVGRDPVPVAQAAKRLGVPIFTVALGTADGTVEGPTGPIAVPPDPATLQQIAEASGGHAFTAQDADGLTSVYRELGSKLGTKDEEREVTVGFVAGGLVLLAAGLAGGVRVRSVLT